MREYFLAAKNSGNQCALFLDGQDREQYLSRLECSDLNLGRGLSEGWFICSEARELYRSGGSFVVSEVHQRVETAATLAVASGYSGVSAAVQMSWSRDSKIDPVILAEHEYGLNSLFERVTKLQGLCLYSRAVFDVQEMALQCVCHPTVVTPEQILVNPLSGFDHSSKRADEIKNYWDHIANVGGALAHLSGAKASFAKTILEKALSSIYIRYVEVSDRESKNDLLRQVELLTSKIEQLGFREQIGSAQF